MKNRLATREGHLNDALEDVAAKAYFLCRKYMRGEKMIRIAGNRKWAAVTLDTIQDVDVEFEMVSYNPIKTNPAVMIETLLQLIPLLQQDPNIDARQLSEELIKGLGMPTSLLMPEEDVAEAAQMQMEQQQQMALGGAAAGGGGPPMGAEGPVSPEESLAAGGGSPIRGEA